MPTILAVADVLTADSDYMGRRVLALEDYGIHYALTRDRSVELDDAGTFHVFSCKDISQYNELQMDHPVYRRLEVPVYETWIVGQVYSTLKSDGLRMASDTNVRTPILRAHGGY